MLLFTLTYYHLALVVLVVGHGRLGPLGPLLAVPNLAYARRIRLYLVTVTFLCALLPCRRGEQRWFQLGGK